MLNFIQTKTKKIWNTEISLNVTYGPVDSETEQRGIEPGHTSLAYASSHQEGDRQL